MTPIRFNILYLVTLAWALGLGALIILTLVLVETIPASEPAEDILIPLLVGVAASCATGIIALASQVASPEPNDPPNHHKDLLDHQYRMAQIKADRE